MELKIDENIILSSKNMHKDENNEETILFKGNELYKYRNITNFSKI